MNDKTLRQVFGAFKKSKVCFEMKSFLLRQQLGLCPTTKEFIHLTDQTHLSHIISLKNLEQLRLINPIKAEQLVTDERNLFLEKASSNKKRSSHNCDALLFDLLAQLDLTEEELKAINAY